MARDGGIEKIVIEKKVAGRCREASYEEVVRRKTKKYVVEVEMRRVLVGSGSGHRKTMVEVVRPSKMSLVSEVHGR